MNNLAEMGGDGSREHPFHRLVDAAAASAPGDTIFVFAGDGTPRGLSDGIRLKERQTLVGEGAGLVVDGKSRIPAGARPVITNLAGVGIELANDAAVRGIAIRDTLGEGLAARDARNVVLEDLVIEGTRGHGLLVESVSGLVVRRTTFRDIGLVAERDAMHALDLTGEVVIAETKFEAAGDDLIEIVGSGRDLSLTFEDVAFGGPSANDGVRLLSGGAVKIGLSFERCVFRRIAGNAIQVGGIGADSDAPRVSVRVSQCTFEDNPDGGNAILVNSQSRGRIEAVVTDSVIRGAAATALLLSADDDSTLIARIGANSIRDITQGEGIALFADETSTMKVTIERNDIADVATGGVLALASGDAVLGLEIHQNPRLDVLAGEGISVTAMDRARVCLEAIGNGISTPGKFGIALSREGSAVLAVGGVGSGDLEELLRRENGGAAVRMDGGASPDAKCDKMNPSQDRE